MLKTQSRVALTPAQKKEKLEAIRTYHEDLFQYHGINPIDFNMKSIFSHNGVKVIGLFANELKKKNGFYLELIDSNLNPLDENRTVYSIGPIDNYEDVYEMTVKGTYMVPLEELDIVEKPRVPEPEKFDVDFNSLHEGKDENISNMTIKDFAAIMWGKPVSDKQWLNNLVNQNVVD